MKQTKEIFKDITGYEGYQASNLGNVKSLKRKSSTGKQVKERVLKSGLNGVIGNQYLAVNLYKNGKSKSVRIHQLVCMAFLNHVPNGYKGLIVDHINNDKLDNRLSNLQLVTARLNSSKDRKNKTSKYTGVFWHKKANKWQSSIGVNGKLKYLGLFTNELEASKCYQEALKEINK